MLAAGVETTKNQRLPGSMKLNRRYKGNVNGDVNNNGNVKDARLKGKSRRPLQNQPQQQLQKSRRHAGATKSLVVLTHAAGPQNYRPRVAFFFDFAF
jgi:hypothetical protein